VPSSLSLSFDKPVYAPGELVTMTGSYEAGSSFTVTVQAEAVDPDDPSNAASATGSYQVQPTAPQEMAVTVKDNHAGTWSQTSNANGVAVFTQPAPSGTRAVPSGFSGPEPSAAALTSQGVPCISWSGFTWEVENWGTENGQPAAANVAIDENGHLILTADTVGDNYRGGEVDSARGDTGLGGNTTTWGYGTYRWVIGTDLTTVPSPLVLGLCTYWAQSKGGPAGQKEIDIEVSNWSNPVPPFLQLGFYQDTGAAETAAVLPGQTLITGSQVTAKSAPAATVEFVWMPTYIAWNVWYGTDTTKTPDYSHTAIQGQTYDYMEPYSGNHFAGTIEIPATGSQQVIMNLWSYGQQALTDSFQIVLESFSYIPSS
jgi:hypothetical protein